MKNNITEDKFPNIPIKNIQNNNKLYNSYSDVINSNLNYNNNSINLSLNNRPKKKNIFFNINGRDFNFNNDKDYNSYLYINSERKKIQLNNLNLKTEAKSVGQRKIINKIQYYLPVLMEKKKDKLKIYPYLKESKPINKLGVLKQANLYEIKNNNANINNENNNSISLHLNTVSNNKKIKSKKHNFRYKYNYSNDGKNKKLDDYLEKIKNYRKRLKDQMIQRYKFQYSQHSIKRTNEKENIKFIFNYDDKYINNIDENVNKALNIFYGKIPSSKVSGYEKAFLKYSNDSTEKYLSSEENNKGSNTVDIKLNENNKNL